MSNAIKTIEHEGSASSAVVSQADATLAVIERVARDPSIDVEKLERLLAMQERILSRNAEMAFNSAMREAKTAMPHVLRDSENSHTRSRYAKLETISKAVDPIIHQSGFTLSFGTDASRLEGHYGVTCEVSHVEGHTKLFRADVPSDAAGAKGASNKNLTQAFGSTMTYGRRYLKCMIFDIQITNEDDDGHTAGNGSAREPAPKSSAQLKRDIDWKSIEAEARNDLLDCQSIRDVRRLGEAYWQRANKEGWNTHYRNAMQDIFLAREEEIAAQEDGR